MQDLVTPDDNAGGFGVVPSIKTLLLFVCLFLSISFISLLDYKSLTVKEINFSNGALSPPFIYRESCPLLFTRN